MENFMTEFLPILEKILLIFSDINVSVQFALVAIPIILSPFLKSIFSNEASFWKKLRFSIFTFVIFSILFLVLITPHLLEYKGPSPDVVAYDRFEKVKIHQIYSYSFFGSGDIALAAASESNSKNEPSLCSDGFWFKITDPGYEYLSAVLNAAFASQETITVYAWSDWIWNGSSGKFCRLYAIRRG